MRVASLVLLAGILTAGAQAAAAQAPVRNTAALVTSVDTFAFRVNGQTFGTQVVRFERTADGFSFTETTAVPNATQTTNVMLDADLGLKSVKQEGQVGGQAMSIDVSTSGGRAQGHARVPGPAGMEDREIDTALPAEAIDDNVLMSILPALPWSESASFELPIFASGRNEVSTWTFRVTRVEDVTTPAGSTKAFRVEIGGAQPLVIHVAATAPHRLLRLEVVGTPMEIVRTGGS